ncbi:MAG: hypothetical protein JRM79_00095 [Nitrososphaerota archaeon]|jgi:hypothetical protein|nr:hypothetical protein [Nitrososphaerota archaeon]MDG6941189.1 hypothetical protein [Nitrososphaerota archaeon]MDG6945756.1 hypothetical protein [Nitrososphaerota archaeon]MDG6952337.1 hypothetical protein [Nitrososphaerota archaeon]MDG6958053.1 hypothetical protein [Nitrososphaerota archaeon]
MSNGQPEVILAQEQGTEMRTGGVSKGLEAEFGGGVKEGTLVLTNRRLIFVCTDDKGEELPVGYFAEHLLLYSEVEGLGDIPNKAPNVFIPLDSASVKGHKGGLGRPSLRVSWRDEGGAHDVVFTETLTGRRRTDLSDWASAIEGMRSGTRVLVSLPPPPSAATLEGKVMHVLADMQEKGTLEIEESVEDEYKVDLDPDQVQAACDRLSAQKLLVRLPDPSGDVFYRRASPLGEDSFSS